jgi:hypothetical protein
LELAESEPVTQNAEENQEAADLLNINTFTVTR